MEPLNQSNFESDINIPKQPSNIWEKSAPHSTSLARIVQRAGFSSEELDSALALTVAKRHWTDLVGPILSRKSIPHSFNNGVLKIVVLHSAYAQEIQYKTEPILIFLNQKIRKKLIFKLEFKQGTLGSKILSNSNPPEKEPSFEGKEKLVEMVEKIDDETRRKTLLNLVKYL